MSVGHEHSLFLEFIALQREVRFTDHPIFEKVGTGSILGETNKNGIQVLCRIKMRSCY